MPLKGLHLELLRRDSFKFLEYEDKFGTDTLVKLYKVHYSGTKDYRLRSEEWSSAFYFHGTAHCGCLNIRAQNSNEYNEPNEWGDDGETEDADVFDEEQQQVDGVVSAKEKESMSAVGETRMTRIRIGAQDWCSGTYCQTKGILTCGHRRLLILRGEGHYFSEYYETAKYFALQKLGQLKQANTALQKRSQFMTAEAGLLYSVFICRVRNVSMASYKYVSNDEDILPYYLAIVRHGNGFVAEPKFEGDRTLFV